MKRTIFLLIPLILGLASCNNKATPNTSSSDSSNPSVSRLSSYSLFLLIAAQARLFFFSQLPVPPNSFVAS